MKVFLVAFGTTMLAGGFLIGAVAWGVCLGLGMYHELNLPPWCK
jgi:hypothetical protein